MKNHECNKIYSFSAIVGQEEMKRALILNVINPKIGGVLIRGEKGTAKSTAVRALADVLGEREEVEGCRYSCDPHDSSFWCDDCKASESHRSKAGVMKVIDLPVSATEDRVVGTLDMEYAIKNGEKRFEPGILASANRNILYVDEVNLLDDHIVDILLDAAAMGVNTVEREGISYSHPARFVLVGTMNPEEGDIRPQLTDRFGLVVDVRGEYELEDRMEIVKRRLSFEDDPASFAARFEHMQTDLRKRILSAKERLSGIKTPDKCIRTAAAMAIHLGVDGHRSDITMIKAAITNAAFEGRDEVSCEDLVVASRLALPHRLRRKPFEEGSWDFEDIRERIEDEWTV